jgi:uncharacterized protein YcaQ
MSLAIEKSLARSIWLKAQRLDSRAPFGVGPAATLAAVEHLGYVQIDTINVIERCHHHILFSRIPHYRRANLRQAQSVDKSVFEYWTHALSYVPTSKLKFFLPAMRRRRISPEGWFRNVSPADVKKLLARIRADGPLSIRDFDDEVLVDKDHPWASRKPSKRVAELAFFRGDLVVSTRSGMLKTYELTDRHFGFAEPVKPATENQVAAYLLERALLSQGIVSLDSICHLDAKSKAAVRLLIERKVKRKELVPVHLVGEAKAPHWVAPDLLDAPPSPVEHLVHVLSPFDPLIIQRKRTHLFFDYQHLFEAYLPAEKRQVGYFALPVLIGDRIVGAIDLKTDRAAKKLLVQKWTIFGGVGADEQAMIDAELERFERFQLGA